MLEYITAALNNLRRNKMRSFLTMLGILIGIAAVITVFALGAGGKTVIEQELMQFGINRFWIYSKTSKGASAGIDLTMEDMQYLRDRLKSDDICPSAYVISNVGTMSKDSRVELVGTDEAYLEVWQADLQSGRFINRMDAEYAHRVAVIGTELAEQLFMNENPLGKEINIQGITFEVVGILRNESIAQQMTNDRVLIPISTYLSMENQENIDEIAISASTPAMVESMGKQAVEILVQKNGVLSAYRTFNLAKEMELANNILDIFSLVMGVIAGISLIIGGVGIMNILLVSVKERSQEIGIKKALGARRKHILSQFITEALCYSFTGCILGTLLGIAASKLVAQALGLGAVITGEIIALACTSALAIGLFFGIYPAFKASKLDPVDAMRVE
ncbi:MAG: ABC transporter permease [Christensenellales bacterium]|jgi:putative ABC transport system permease protein